MVPCAPGLLVRPLAMRRRRMYAGLGADDLGGLAVRPLCPGSFYQTECWGESYAALVPQDYLLRVRVSKRRERELKSPYVAAVHQGTGVASRLLIRALEREPAHRWVYFEVTREPKPWVTFAARHRWPIVPAAEVPLEAFRYPGAGSARSSTSSP